MYQCFDVLFIQGTLCPHIATSLHVYEEYHMFHHSNILHVWYITRHAKSWRGVLDGGWQSHLPFRAKVFLWCVIVGGLPLAMALKRRHVSNGTIFFLTNDEYFFLFAHSILVFICKFTTIWIGILYIVLPYFEPNLLFFHICIVAILQQGSDDILVTINLAICLNMPIKVITK